jgi:hypothetical protein
VQASGLAIKSYSLAARFPINYQLTIHTLNPTQFGEYPETQTFAVPYEVSKKGFS